MNDFVPKGSPLSPHKAVLWIKYEVHDVLPTGECSGRPSERGDKVFEINGADRAICVRKLHEALAMLEKSK